MYTANGNILDLAEDGHFDFVIHGCNCFNTMGAGLALQIKTRYPQVYEADCRTKCGDKTKLGTYSFATVGTAFTIFNLYTQYGFANNHRKDVFEYEHFENGMRSLVNTWGKGRYALPMIGCGLAGGDMGRILNVMDSINQQIEDMGGTLTLVIYP